MTFDYFLNDFSYAQIVFFYIFCGLAVMHSAHFVMYRFFPKLQIQELDSDFIAGLHAALFTITFLTLGYSLSNADEAVNKYQHDVAIEASEMEGLDILLMLYDTKDSYMFRHKLRKYANSIVTDEWPKLSINGGSEKTLYLLTEMGSELKGLNPTSQKQLVIYSQILEASSKIFRSRSDRIFNSQARVAPQFLTTNNIGYIGVLLISALMLTQFTWFRFIALNIQIIAVSFIFASTIVLDNPFKGSDGVSPNPIITFANSSFNSSK